MKNLMIVNLVALLFAGTSFAGGHDPKVILSLLKDSKVSLLQGIEQAEKTSGPATSAKFETTDDGKLALSIYTIPEGLGVEPEKATLTELAGDPTASPFKPEAEVFADKEHIARASVHMTLFQQSRLTLKQIVQKAQSRVGGVAIDVRNPMVRNKRSVADVIVAAKDGDIYVVTVDLANGFSSVKEIE
jgi:hypothetical protein